MPVPAGLEGEILVRVVAIDRSESVKKAKNLSTRSRSAAAFAINDSPLGTYIILVAFGDEATVVDDRYIYTPHDRAVLYEKVEAIRMDDQHTDVGVLEVLLSEIHTALGEHYQSQGFQLKIQVLSDGDAKPVDPSQVQTFDSLLGQKSTRSELGDGLYIYEVNFHQAAKTTENTSPTEVKDELQSEVRVVITETTEEREPEQVRRVFEHKHTFLDLDKKGGQPSQSALDEQSIVHEAIAGVVAVLNSPLGRFSLGVALLVAVVILLVFLKRARKEGHEVIKRAGLEDEDEQEKLTLTPHGLVLTEWSIKDKKLMQARLPIVYQSQIPLVIGSDAAHANVVLQTPDTPARFLSLTLDSQGQAKVSTFNGGFELDGEPVRKSAIFSAEEQHIIRSNQVELHLEPASVLPGSEEDFFRRLSQERTEEEDQAIEQEAVA